MYDPENEDVPENEDEETQPTEDSTDTGKPPGG